MRNPRFRVLFKIIITPLVLFTLLYNSSFIRVSENEVNNRRVMQEFSETSLNVSKGGKNDEVKLMDLHICDEFFDHKGYKSSCEFLIAHPDCTSGGYFNYIKFFYCDCQNYSFLGYLVLGAWLAVLFYLLGNTAADYFCCSLENFSNFLKMSPTVAGVTLLPLGNGASDVFASIAAFMGTGSGDMGVNGILGGAVFIICIVVGVVSLSVADRRVQIDRKCFIRDLCFFLFTILCLTVIMIIGKVSIWGAIAFVSIYVVYAFFVAVNEILRKKGRSLILGGFTPLLPVAGSFFSAGGEESDSVNDSLLSPASHGDLSELTPKQAHLIWRSNFAMFSDYYVKVPTEDILRPIWGWSDEEEQSVFSFSKLCWLLEMPLSIPRRLTIPIVEEGRWSKMFAVASAFLAPVLLAFLWNTREDVNPLSGKIAYSIGFGIGFTLSVLASLYTTIDHPPRRFLFPWVFGGFFMSIIWFYVVADELVSLLVSLGTILGISPSMLALTVLAWGNSMNDLMSNTAFAMNERNGVQIAMSGCYAGPMFNTLIGLGLSLVLGTWSMGSEPYLIPRDTGLFVTMGFLTAGVVWSLVVLPMYDMRPNKILGIGLIIIYVMFLSLRICMAIGLEWL